MMNNQLKNLIPSRDLGGGRYLYERAESNDRKLLKKPSRGR